MSKLAYEWKNIYRNLCNRDTEDNFLVKISDFDKVCQIFKVNLTNEEVKKIRELF